MHNDAPRPAAAWMGGPDTDLDRPVKVFIVSRRGGGCGRVLWVMSERDARKVCQDPRTAGQNYGLHWTAAGVDTLKPADFVADDGQHAAVLAELGVTVLASRNRPPTNPRRH